MSIFIYLDKNSFSAIALLYSKFLEEYKKVITFSSIETFNYSKPSGLDFNSDQHLFSILFGRGIIHPFDLDLH
ncbi:hypothetical protein [Leptospira licerasiae]|uniref:hypothetical protein n=1 Tax=Leptospira licerasiae TaxID=447106 RepID=UPI0030192F35